MTPLIDGAPGQVDNYGSVPTVDMLVTYCPPTSLMVGQGLVFGAPPSTRTLAFTGFIGELYVPG